MIELLEYLDERQRSPFAIWRSKLDASVRARIEISLVRLRQGNVSAIKGVGEGVLELRLDFGPGYRIYLARDGDHYMILLGGGSKSRQANDISLAKARWKDYKRSKQEQV